MNSFKDLSAQFEAQFKEVAATGNSSLLYEASSYILGIGGKRVRPVLALMGNELFGEILPESYHVANAVELFHNFTLVHDDIMDNAPLRRGQATVHSRFGINTALLSGDVLLVKAYEELNKIPADRLTSILSLFNRTAREVCEGQQLDMDFEKKDVVEFRQYLDMIALKTSVLLAASLQMGAIMGGAGLGNQDHLYEFGKNLGIAFQVQDDYLDAFGDPEKFGKVRGGDILANKKTFLLIHTMEEANDQDRLKLQQLLGGSEPGKVEAVLEIYRRTGSDEWADTLKEAYFQKAMNHLEDIAVISERKKGLADLARLLLLREN